MTNDEILDRLPALHPGQDRTILLEGIQALRQQLHMLTTPVRAELEAKAAAMIKAAEALQALPEPYRHFYGGIGDALLGEAQDLNRRAEAIPKREGRPVETRKLAFVAACGFLVEKNWDIPIRSIQPLTGPDGMDSRLPWSLASGYPPPKPVLLLARGIWEDEGLEITSAKNWENVIRNNWRDFYAEHLDPMRGWEPEYIPTDEDS